MGGTTMKNKLKHSPYLRFIDAATAESGGDTESAKESAAESPRQVDWEAEARKWKELSRKNEARMKENAEKAKLYDKAQEEGKSDLQKAQEVAAKAEARVAELESKALRMEVAAAKGVDAELLSGSTQEELEACAERLLAWRGAQVPKGAPASDAGVRGDEIRAAKQLTREDLKSMSAEQINHARRSGQLNELMGLA
nr:MAG TPA: hypothetical protein [Caudoviricetes sp.]